MHLSARLSVKYTILLVMLSVIATAAATMTLFMHTFPSVTTTPPPAAMTSPCTTLVNESPSPLEGTGGTIVFDCGSTPILPPSFSPIPALHIVATSAKTVTPTFTLPSTYTGLYIVPAVGIETGTCDPTTGLALTSGTSITVGGSAFPKPNDYIQYCAPFTSAPSSSFASFTVTWTQ